MTTKHGYNKIYSKMYNGVKIALIDRQNNFQPYVVCYGYDDESDTWMQGHYFEDLAKAINYMDDNY